MKKSIALIIFIFLFSFAEKLNAISASFSPVISYNNNSSAYAIYDEKIKNSLLEWNASYFAKAGYEAKFNFGAFSLSNTTLFNLPLKCGNQYDSDWRTQNIKTNYSTGDLYTDFGFDFEVEIKYQFKAAETFYIFPLLAFKNYYTQFRAKNIWAWCGDTYHTGLGQNVEWNDAASVRVKKYGIDLYSEIAAFYLGFELEKTFGPLALGTKVLLSPYTFMLNVDHHLNKEEGHWYQLIEKAVFKTWDFSLYAEYEVKAKNFINLAINTTFCPQTPGDFYFGYFDIENIIADETSTFGFSFFSIKMGWRIQI